MRKEAILVVDDKPSMLTLLAKVLGKSARVVTARGVRDALAVLDREPLLAVVCDLRMEDGSGLDVLRATKAKQPTVPFLLLTAHATVDTAVQAMREGASDYITKPFDPARLRAQVEKVVATSAILARDPETGGGADYAPFVGRSPRMQEVYALIERFAKTDSTVLITGETGTGKELVARALHRRSPRATQAMVAINCAAIPSELLESELFGHARGAFTGAVSDRAGMFEAANKGTLFLDELGEMRPSLQAKLTRVLEQRTVRRLGESKEREIDVRVVAATHRNLDVLVASGQFREDLVYRLRVCTIELPPLRDRAGDVRRLATDFLATLGPTVGSSAIGFSDDALDALDAYAWPGNVRELRSVVEQTAILARRRIIDTGDLPRHVADARSMGVVPAAQMSHMSLREVVDSSREAVVRLYLESLLQRFRGGVPEASAQAGIEPESFYRLLRKHGLTAEAFRSDEPGLRRAAVGVRFLRRIPRHPFQGAEERRNAPLKEARENSDGPAEQPWTQARTAFVARSVRSGITQRPVRR